MSKIVFAINLICLVSLSLAQELGFDAEFERSVAKAIQGFRADQIYLVPIRNEKFEKHPVVIFSNFSNCILLEKNLINSINEKFSNLSFEN